MYSRRTCIKGSYTAVKNADCSAQSIYLIIYRSYSIIYYIYLIIHCRYLTGHSVHFTVYRFQLFFRCRTAGHTEVGRIDGNIFQARNGGSARLTVNDNVAGSDFVAVNGRFRCSLYAVSTPF